MKIRSIILLSLLLFCIQTVIGQVTESKSYKSKKATFSYAQYGTIDSLRDRLIIALPDTTNSAWKPAAWAQELSWLADEENACVLAPEATFTTLSASIVEGFIAEQFPGLDSTQIRFIALGSGANGVCTLLELGYNGLLIAPMKSCVIKEPRPDRVVAVANTRSTDSAKVWTDSLQRFGVWVQQEWVISDEMYYFEHREEVLLKLWNWVDDQVDRLQDSVWLAAYQTELTSTIPEVIREGKKVELILEVAQEGEFEIDLLDLSAHPVHEVKEFLGKGTHRFEIPTKGLNWGVYKLEVDGPKMIEKHKIMIRG